MLKPLLDALRAKSKEDKNYLLKDHLRETIERAVQLREFVNVNKSVIKYDGFNNEFFNNLIKACFLHDLGKINWKFQWKVYEKEEKEFDEEERKYKNKHLNELYNFFGEFRKIDIKDHEIISLVYSLIFLDSDEWAQKIRTAILLHHYNNFYDISSHREVNILNILENYRYGNLEEELKNYTKFLIEKQEQIENMLSLMLEDIIGDVKDKVAKNVLERLKKNLKDAGFDRLKKFEKSLKRGIGVTRTLKMFEIPGKESKNFYDFFVFLGCLRRCDYSASGNVDIERKTKDEKIVKLKEDVYKNLLENIKKSIGQEGKEIWQEKFLDKEDTKNTILIAPTGSGKTEFALLWAKNRGKKLIYTLPLRVALNDLFWRFKEKGEDKQPYFDPSCVDILHSTSFIEYLKGEAFGGDINVGTKVSGARILSSPILLTTPDQVFLSSLKHYGFDKLLSIYPLSAIVIDEIQAYNPEMAAVIIKTLEIIRKLNGDVLVITATFPPYFEEFLNEKNGFKKIDLEEESTNIKNQIKNYNLKRHKIKLLDDMSLFEYEKKDREHELKLIDDSYEKIKTIVNENPGKNILIIVNNVGKAIELYKRIEKDIGNVNSVKVNKESLYLLHSRLIEKEKARRIEEIKKKLGKERIILVATQIVEASVDVDFDILITEISPIDSQIQRWGRVWRNRKENYEEKNENGDIVPNIYIFTEIENDKGTLAIYYPKEVLEKTIETLREVESRENPLDYKEERKLIEEVFKKTLNDGETLKKLYENKINETREWLKYYSAEKRTEAQRIFRRIAGIQVVVSDLMEKSNSPIEKAFGKIIKDKENWKLPWKSEGGECIVEKVKNELSNENENNKVTRWELLRILYSYSFNLPIFSFGKNNQNEYKILEGKNFKGFFMLKTKELDLEEIEKYGVNKLRDINIDSEESKISENNIL